MYDKGARGTVIPLNFKVCSFIIHTSGGETRCVDRSSQEIGDESHPTVLHHTSLYPRHIGVRACSLSILIKYLKKKITSADITVACVFVTCIFFFFE